MRESVTYQDILAEGEVKGKTQGLVEGRVEGRVEEARALVVRQLSRKLGNVSPSLLAKVEALPLARLESLGEDLLDFTSMTDLAAWLSQN